MMTYVSFSLNKPFALRQTVFPTFSQITFHIFPKENFHENVIILTFASLNNQSEFSQGQKTITHVRSFLIGKLN